MPLHERTRRDRDRTLNHMLDYIRTYIEEQGFAPSTREIAAACGLALGSVPYYLDKLEARGKIQREMGQARSIKVLNGRQD